LAEVKTGSLSMTMNFDGYRRYGCESSRCRLSPWRAGK
jgi:hypothetical protein